MITEQSKTTLVSPHRRSISVPYFTYQCTHYEIAVVVVAIMGAVACWRCIMRVNSRKVKTEALFYLSKIEINGSKEGSILLYIQRYIGKYI